MQVNSVGPSLLNRQIENETPAKNIEVSSSNEVNQQNLSNSDTVTLSDEAKAMLLNESNTTETSAEPAEGTVSSDESGEPPAKTNTGGTGIEPPANSATTGGTGIEPPVSEG